MLIAVEYKCYESEFVLLQSDVMIMTVELRFEDGIYQKNDPGALYSTGLCVSDIIRCGSFISSYIA